MAHNNVEYENGSVTVSQYKSIAFETYHILNVHFDERLATKERIWRL